MNDAGKADGMVKRTVNLLTRRMELFTTADAEGIRRFGKALALFLLLQLLIFICLLGLRTLRDSQNYWGATIDKHERLENAPGPRLILIGGSGLALGINSGLLEEMTGYNPVNMSMAAGLGPDFMTMEVLTDVRPGDVVVVILSYEALLTNTTNRCILGLLHSRPASIVYVRDPLAVLTMYVADLGNELRGASRAVWEPFTERLGLRTPTPSETRWSRNSFNRYGDVCYDRKHNENLFEMYYRLPEARQGYPDSVITLLNTFARECSSRGGIAVWSFPAIPDSTYAMNRDVIENLHERLREELELEIINVPEEMTLPFGMFYDTGYHLTLEGAEIRSRILGEGLMRSAAYVEGAGSRL